MDPLYALPCLLVPGFTLDFQFYDHYTIHVHILPFHLLHLSPTLILSYYEYSLLDINCCISTCS